MLVRVAVLAPAASEVSQPTRLTADGASFWAHRINFTIYARYDGDAADLSEAGSSVEEVELCPENGDGRGARWYVTMRCDARRASPWAHTLRVGDQTVEVRFEPEARS